MVKVLIVDDSLFARKILTDILNSDKDIEVVGVAKNGKEALEKIPILKPDLVTLDVVMPIMDGIVTLERIVDKYDIPVIMVSDLTQEGATLTLEALDKGAIDFIPKPKNIFSLNSETIKTQIIDKIKISAQCNIYVKPVIKEPKSIPERAALTGQASKDSFDYIIAIGSSTGGPKALQQVLPLIPKNINGSIVVVQHMPPKFTKSLAQRLNEISSINIKEGEEGEVLKRGHCYIAPGDFHMEVVKRGSEYVIRLNKDSPIKGLRPSVDVLMDSVARLDSIRKIGVILTGMGSDGSKGIVSIKQSNGFTIAQDEKTSVIFGMPKSAINTNHVDKVVPLDEIAYEITRKVEVL
ncbi:protein-glutamate methylesterase/protein-glutamine glutaminase [Tepidimicrobium xylanilyticum]|uniref:protein-glutamate methylesterase/protein-glutamine glutaminase n=1 Tax=Tepidimicrobium xylanilyticum TaxID=1123352 RepID=UPI002650E571|nr:chemotaxis response regulator protein-glutamate methylesterase [Tepidimicrobium xylanilyticum]GMG97118.1 chemotaxis response regulator protein-glutamate methylesterase [Tepidimicrobium xylanilyticum]